MRKMCLCLFLAMLCGLSFSQSVGNYSFSSSSNVFSSITDGTVLGDTSTNDQFFLDPSIPLGGTTSTGPGFPIGFNFFFNGYNFDRFGISADGWIALGNSSLTPSVNMTSTNAYQPLGSTSAITPPHLVSRISGLGMNLCAVSGASLRYKQIGEYPNRVLVVQWNGYKKSTGGTGDNFSFQIRLHETSYAISIVYGNMTVGSTASNAQVGFRASPASSATSWRNRSTSSNWASTVEGSSTSSTCLLSSSIMPASGTTFTWIPPTPISGIYGIVPGGDFDSFTQAINFLNSTVNQSGLGQGGITFNVPAGSVFYENPPAIELSGWEGREVIFQRSGEGANPSIRSTGTASGAESIIKLNGVDWYTFNGIDLCNAGTTTAMEYGLLLSSISGYGCDHNTIINCRITLSNSTAGTRAVLSTSLSGTPNSYNTYSGLTIDNSDYGIYLVGMSSAITHNETVWGNTLNSIASSGIAIVYGTAISCTVNVVNIMSGASNSVNAIQCGVPGGTATISDNVIHGSSASGNIYGIYVSNGNVIVSGNTIEGFICSNGSCNGIYVNDGYVDIMGNHVYNLRGNRSVSGIFAATSTDQINIQGNRIHRLVTTATTGSYFLSGLNVGGTLTKVYNNMVWDLVSSLTANSPMLRGITTLDGTSIKLWNNSVLLNSTNSSSDFISAAVYLSSATPQVELMNNILVNLSLPGSGANGKAVAFMIATENFNSISPASDRNLYYSGIPGTKNLICQAGSYGYYTLQDYIIANAGKDQNCMTEEPPFQSYSDPVDLHIASGIITCIEGSAIPIDEVDVDIDGNPRNPLTPDIGADEGIFGLVEQIPLTNFETGWGNWVAVNGSQANKWVTGTATSFGGNSSAYISSDAEMSNSYNLAQPSVSHIYMDIQFPSDLAGYRLLFNWKGMGEAGSDFLIIHIVDSSYLPVAGVVPPDGQIGGFYHSASNWLTEQILLPAELSGQAKRLVFSWQNDSASGVQPPVAIDNIRILGILPVLQSPPNIAICANPDETCTISWDGVDMANEYRVESAANADGPFSTLGWTGNPHYNVHPLSERMFFRILASE